MTKLKICGLTTQDDASIAEQGADALGFIFYDKSPRYVSPLTVSSFQFNPFITKVGVFVNHSKDEILSIKERCKLDVIQLHGDESPEFCSLFSSSVIKAIRLYDEESVNQIELYKGVVTAILLDTYSKDAYGGTGKTFNWDLAIHAKRYGIPLILSGGLTARNVKEAIDYVNPYAVDLSSGVELYPGKKDHNKLIEVMKYVEKI